MVKERTNSQVVQLPLKEKGNLKVKKANSRMLSS